MAVPSSSVGRLHESVGPPPGIEGEPFIEAENEKSPTPTIVRVIAAAISVVNEKVPANEISPALPSFMRKGTAYETVPLSETRYVLPSETVTGAFGSRSACSSVSVAPSVSSMVRYHP